MDSMAFQREIGRSPANGVLFPIIDGMPHALVIRAGAITNILHQSTAFYVKSPGTNFALLGVFLQGQLY